MHRGPAFGDILAEKLCDVQAGVARSSGARTGFGSATAPLFLDGEPRFHFHAAPYGRAAASAERQARYGPFIPTSVSDPPVPPAPPAVRISRRVLSPRQQRALDALVGFGATLGADFSEAELRSAFRALARRYHPDRHPGSQATEQHRLARVFSQLADHYRELLAATRRPVAVN